MRLKLRWRDRKPSKIAEIAIEWWDEFSASDLRLEDTPEVHECGWIHTSAEDLDIQLRDEIEADFHRGNTSGSKQIVETCGMSDQPEYLGTVEWELVGDTSAEREWISEELSPAFRSNAQKLKRRLMNG